MTFIFMTFVLSVVFHDKSKLTNMKHTARISPNHEHDYDNHDHDHHHHHYEHHCHHPHGGPFIYYVKQMLYVKYIKNILNIIY